MKRLANFYDGELWFDNPQLVIANPKRRKKTMRSHRTRRGRINRTRRAKRNFYSAGMLANRPKRRRPRHNRRRRSVMRAKRNFYFNPPRRRRAGGLLSGLTGGRSFLGFQLPPMDAVLFAAAGLIGPGLVSNQLLGTPATATAAAKPGLLPASWLVGSDGKPNQITLWLTKIASVLLPAWAIRKFISPKAGTMFLIGGSAGLALDAIKTFAPGIIPGLGSQPLLGAYFDQPRAVANFPRPVNRLPGMIADAPSRLSPQERF